MPWVKLDDRFPSHRKIALLSDRAFRLHVAALCWASENLTEGRIADRELPLVAKIRNIKATAQQLADAGVWDRTEDGWEIHDYLDYNPSREQVLAERKKNAERQERFRQRKNGKPTPPSNGVRNGASNGVTPDHGSGAESHDGDTNAARRRHDGDTTATGNRHEEQTDPQVNGVRNGVSNGAPSRPVPNPSSMADVDGGSNGSSATRNEPQNAPIDDADFAITDGMRRWAHRDGYAALIDIDHSTAQFVSHYRSTGARRKSWPDAWQKWIRDDARRATQRASPTQGSFLVALPGGDQPTRPLTGTDAKVAGWAAIAAQLAEQQGDSA